MIRRLTKINAFKEVSDLKESTRGIFTLDLYFFVVSLRLNIQSFERLEVSREKQKICWSAILFICFQVQEERNYGVHVLYFVAGFELRYVMFCACKIVYLATNAM